MPDPAIRHYECGWTEHDLSQVFTGHPSETRVFPSGVFLFEHDSGERVLYDTGYPPDMDGTGLKGKLYTKMLPPHVAEGDTVDSKLAADDIDPASIGTVVLSHLHPDHIGGVRYFPQARFVLSAGMRRTLQRPGLRDGLLPGLLPDWFPAANSLILDDDDMRPSAHDGLRGHDLFGDGSLVLTELPGHARGQLGAVVLGRTLLAGDAAWGADMLDSIGNMRRIPRMVQHDYQAYFQTAQQLRRLADDGMELRFSHDRYDQTTHNEGESA